LYNYFKLDDDRIYIDKITGFNLKLIITNKLADKIELTNNQIAALRLALNVNRAII